jgi:hypothetical protein
VTAAVVMTSATKMSQRNHREPKRGAALAGLACDVGSGISGFTALTALVSGKPAGAVALF